MNRNQQSGIVNMPTKEFLGWKIAQTVTSFCLTLCIGASSWTVLAVVDLREQVAVGKAARMSLQDQSKGIASELAALKNAVAGLPTESPPPWWKAQVGESFARLTAQLQKMEDKLDVNSGKLNGIEMDLKLHLEASKPRTTGTP